MTRTCTRWLFYVVLSVLLNAAIASAIKVPTTHPVPDQPQPMRLNLISAAAPLPPPAQTRRARPPAPPVKKMVTQKRAHKSLTMAKEPPPRVESTAVAEEKEEEAEKNAAPDTARLPSDDGRAATTVIREASYRYQRPPTYPRRALELGQQGTVTLHAQVAPDGLPRALKVVQSSGYELLDNAALTAVKKWEFEPVHVDGEAVAGWVRIPVRFVIEY